MKLQFHGELWGWRLESHDGNAQLVLAGEFEIFGKHNPDGSIRIDLNTQGQALEIVLLECSLHPFEDVLQYRSRFLHGKTRLRQIGLVVE